MKTRKQYMNNECTHREYYAQFVSKSTAQLVARMIGAKNLLTSTDPHLNDIPLTRWDQLDPYVRRPSQLAATGYTGGWSLSDSVCTAKEAARQWIENNS